LKLVVFFWTVADILNETIMKSATLGFNNPANMDRVAYKRSVLLKGIRLLIGYYKTTAFFFPT